MAYEDALYASTLRATSQRQRNTIALTCGNLQLLAATSCDVYSAQGEVHLLSLCLLYDDILGECGICGVQQSAI